MASATEILITSDDSSSSSTTSLVEPTLQSVKEIVFKDVMSGNWHAVADKYKDNKPDIQTASITSSKETVLHIAISDNRSDMALKLLDILAKHPEKIKEMKNDRGNNPLHLAASLGQADMCKVMVSMDPELIRSRNNDGETPLFLAALLGNKKAFENLHDKWADNRNYDDGDISHCKRNDGNSILHVTILGEYFELAFQIFKLYPKLSTCKNDRGQSALHILATNPSAFRSGCHLRPLDDFIYRCFLVEQMEVKMTRSSEVSTAQQNSKVTKIMIPGNYEACFSVVETFRNGIGAVFSGAVSKWRQGRSQCSNLHTPLAWWSYWRKTQRETLQSKQTMNAPKYTFSFPPNYYTFFSFLEFLLELLLVVCGLGFYKVVNMKDKKRKHIQSLQLMKELVSGANSWEDEDTGSKPSDESLRDFQHKKIETMGPPDTSLSAESTLETEKDAKDVHNVAKGTMTMTTAEMQNIMKIISDLMKEKKIQVEAEKTKPDVYNLQMFFMDSQEDGTKEKSPFLVAAKMGVIEMVEEILNKFPVAIDDMNSKKKNAVLLAVENRQPGVYLFFKRRYHEKKSIFQKVDSEGNSALHLAAAFTQNSPWLIPGAALQMQWELKWYKFIEDSMPHHTFAHLNDKRQTPNEVLTVTHRDLANTAGKWLTKTSESCSVVAALIATVAFASATSLPGGVKQDRGTPTFEGEPAFNVFAISSLVALCFSITSLTMFLSILTSRCQVWDFHHSLPSKLILGLISLFLSITLILVSFCSGHFLAIRERLSYAVFPIYAATCLPLTLFIVAQSSLYLDLIRSILERMPKRSFEATSI